MARHSINTGQALPRACEPEDGAFYWESVTFTRCFVDFKAIKNVLCLWRTYFCVSLWRKLLYTLTPVMGGESVEWGTAYIVYKYNYIHCGIPVRATSPLLQQFILLQIL